MKKILILSLALLVSLWSKNLTNPETIYIKKCQSCHKMQSPINDKESFETSAPYITLAMKSVVTGIDAIEEPKNNKELRALVIEHIEDYIFNPTADKSFCEDIIFKKYDYMPSLTRFISKKEAAIVAPWIYDSFAPNKYKVIRN